MKKIIAFLLVLPLLGCYDMKSQIKDLDMAQACEINKQIGKNRKPHQELFLRCVNALNIRPDNQNETLSGLIEQCRKEAQITYPVDRNSFFRLYNIREITLALDVTAEKCLIEPAAESTHTSQMPAEKPHQASAPKTEAVEQ